MQTKRNAIDSLRQKLQERNADSQFSNQFLYNVLLEQAKWLIKREVVSGRVFKNNSLFQSFVVDIIEVSSVDACLNIQTNCKLYRSKTKLPDMWSNYDGPLIKSVTSIDRSTNFFVTNEKTWTSKSNDPYQSKANIKYSFFSDGYLWIPLVNPHKVLVRGFYMDDLSLVETTCDDCNENNECVRFLDTDFIVPDWIEAELMQKALEQLMPSKQLQTDNQVDKNPTRKN